MPLPAAAEAEAATRNQSYIIDAEVACPAPRRWRQSDLASPIVASARPVRVLGGNNTVPSVR